MATPFNFELGSSNPAMFRENALRQLQKIYQDWQTFPGRQPGGTGLTGLTSNDSRGWSQLLQDQSDEANISNLLQGKGPLQVVNGGSFSEDEPFKTRARRSYLQSTDAMRGLNTLYGQ